MICISMHNKEMKGKDTFKNVLILIRNVVASLP